MIWREPIEGPARELLAKADPCRDPEEKSALDEATDLLSDGKVPVVDIRKKAEVVGISWATVRRAKDRLGIKPDKGGLKDGWRWGLPARVSPEDARRCSTDSEDAQRNGVSTFANVEQLRGTEADAEVF